MNTTEDTGPDTARTEPTIGELGARIDALSATVIGKVDAFEKVVLAALDTISTTQKAEYERAHGRIDSLEKRVALLEAERSPYSLAAPRVPSVIIPKRSWFRSFFGG